MRGLILLARRELGHHRARTLILVLSLAVTIFIPLLTHVLVSRYDARLRARSESVPLIAGAAGNRFDLTLASLYFREGALESIPFSEYEELRDSQRGVAIPMNLRFRARGRPIVATGPEYLDRRGLTLAQGRRFLRLGEVVLGAKVAQELGLSVGEALFSDQRELYDITKPPALKMTVCGILHELGQPDDEAVFVDIKTAWILEGLAHGHDEAKSISSDLVMGSTPSSRMISPAMIEYNEVTPSNAASFHFHGTSADLPLTSILFFPHDQKARTIAKAKVNAKRLYQMVEPARVIDDLMSFVFRIKSFLDLIALLLVLATGLLAILVFLLSLKMRRREIETLARIGASRHTVAKLLAIEVAMIVLGALALAFVFMALALALLPNFLSASA